MSELERFTGWYLISKEELAGGRTGGWYIAWLEPFSTKAKALAFTKENGWTKPYRTHHGDASMNNPNLDDVKAADAIALAHGWFKLLRGWYHVNAWQYFGYGNIPVCYRTSQELCEKEGLS